MSKNLDLIPISPLRCFAVSFFSVLRPLTDRFSPSPSSHTSLPARSTCFSISAFRWRRSLGEGRSAFQRFRNPSLAPLSLLLAHLRHRHTNKIITTHAIVVTMTMATLGMRERAIGAGAGLSTRTAVAAGQCPMMSMGVPMSIQS